MQEDGTQGEVLFLNDIAANFLMRHQEQPVRPYLEAWPPICDEIGFVQMKLVALYNLGEIYLEDGDPTETQAVCQRAAAITRRLNDRPNLARALKIVGLAQIQLGDYDSGWASLREGLDVALETGEEASISRKRALEPRLVTAVPKSKQQTSTGYQKLIVEN